MEQLHLINYPQNSITYIFYDLLIITLIFSQTLEVYKVKQLFKINTLSIHQGKTYKLQELAGRSPFSSRSLLVITAKQAELILGVARFS